MENIQISAPEILYESRDMVVCIKAPGLLSEPGSGASLPEQLSVHYRSLGQPGDIFTVHRLDKIVGGVMVFSRRKDVTGKLIAAIAAREIKKEYFAVLCGTPAQPAGTLEDLLFRDAAKNKTYVVQRPRKGVRDAKLDYCVLASAVDGNQAYSLVRIRLHTGRTHQIRVQFASRQLPLLGDIRYGSKDSRCKAALWSCRLALRHPVTGEPLDFFHRPPPEFPWILFPESAFSAGSPFIET